MAASSLLTLHDDLLVAMAGTMLSGRELSFLCGTCRALRAMRPRAWTCKVAALGMEAPPAVAAAGAGGAAGEVRHLDAVVAAYRVAARKVVVPAARMNIAWIDNPSYWQMAMDASSTLTTRVAYLRMVWWLGWNVAMRPTRALRHVMLRYFVAGDSSLRAMVLTAKLGVPTVEGRDCALEHIASFDLQPHGMPPGTWVWHHVTTLPPMDTWAPGGEASAPAQLNFITSNTHELHWGLAVDCTALMTDADLAHLRATHNYLAPTDEEGSPALYFPRSGLGSPAMRCLYGHGERDAVLDAWATGGALAASQLIAAGASVHRAAGGAGGGAAGGGEGSCGVA